MEGDEAGVQHDGGGEGLPQPRWLSEPRALDRRSGQAHVPATDSGAEHRGKQSWPDIMQHNGGARLFILKSKVASRKMAFSLGESGSCASA